MDKIAFTRTEAMKQRTATNHARREDGVLTPLDGAALPDTPEIDMGGHGLYANIGVPPVTCHGIFSPFEIRVRPNEGTDNEA
ncbi:hypothetical protein Q4543_23900, partial [Salipiger sp. 1_MG-2023]|nr:hypothetical protein [Salipiger sp. 1_MG-2023]